VVLWTKFVLVWLLFSRWVQIYKRVMSHIATHMNESCHMYGRGCVSHVAHVNMWCPTYEWVMSHFYMCHFSRMYKSCHTYEWVMSHIWVCHVTSMGKPRPTHEWVMSHTGTCLTSHTNTPSHVTHLKSCHTQAHVLTVRQTDPTIAFPFLVLLVSGWVMSHIWMSRFTRLTYTTCLNVSCHIAFPLSVSLLIRVWAG